jgi:hypothetical protein
MKKKHQIYIIIKKKKKNKTKKNGVPRIQKRGVTPLKPLQFRPFLHHYLPQNTLFPTVPSDPPHAHTYACCTAASAAGRVRPGDPASGCGGIRENRREKRGERREKRGLVANLS